MRFTHIMSWKVMINMQSNSKISEKWLMHSVFGILRTLRRTLIVCYTHVSCFYMQFIDIFCIWVGFFVSFLLYSMYVRSVPLIYSKALPMGRCVINTRLILAGEHGNWEHKHTKIWQILLFSFYGRYSTFSSSVKRFEPYRCQFILYRRIDQMHKQIERR